MNDKTIIEEISLRDEQHEKIGYSTYPTIHSDRATLLAILAEIGALPERWSKETINMSDSPYDCGLDGALRICANQLKAIIERTRQDET